MASPVDVVPVFGNHHQSLYWPEKRPSLLREKKSSAGECFCFKADGAGLASPVSAAVSGWRRWMVARDSGQAAQVWSRRNACFWRDNSGADPQVIGPGHAEKLARTKVWAGLWIRVHGLLI
ncbi:Uncharacterized protein Adt_45191 [Abeliophyllum distichum]|uniref:Uncharacterized protein n=1 Tax=Abeliophyllum distichum TaxID=126358 RepID=A0ABD1PGS7_9LAMI